MPKLPFPAYWLPLILSVICLVDGFLPVSSNDSGKSLTAIRIPVHCGKDKMGYIDGTGKMVLPARWRYASCFAADGSARVTDKHRGYFSISRNGKLRRLPPPPQASQSHPRYRSQGPDERGMTLVWEFDPAHQRLRCHWTLRDGSPAFPGWWDGALPFVKDFPAAVWVDGAWGFIDRKGYSAISNKWDETLGFGASGLAPVARNGRWGAIDATGTLVVPLHFDRLSGFDATGMAAVRIGFGCGYINAKGRIVIPLRYPQAEPFDVHGMARVVDSSHKAGWIDGEGKVRVPFEHDQLESNWVPNDHPRVLPVTVNRLAGLIDRSGKWVVPPASGRIVVASDPIEPGREWYVRAPAWDDPSQAPPPPFEPGCYDETGRRLWSGSGSGFWSTLWLDHKKYARWLVLGFGVAAGVLFLKRRKSPNSG